MAIICLINADTWLVLLMLTFSPTFLQRCPSRCKCSFHKVNCRKTDLKEMPHYIPNSVRYMDFSDNPFIRIKRKAFLKFSHLHTLLLNNCNLKDPIELPSSIKRIELGYNFMTIQSLKEIFMNKTLQPKAIDLRSNGLNITRTLSLIPKGIEYLELSSNNLPSLRTKDLIRFKKLRKISCQQCSLQSIESNAFDYNIQIHIIDLSNNQLADLPNNLFEHNTDLKTLDLRFNNFDNINSSKLKLNRLQVLDIGFNKIKAFDLRSTRFIEIGLENNRITKIDENAFEKSTYIHALKLHNNNINKISQGAFKGIKYISELLLHNNNITYLPEYIFRNLAISKICLHKNQLSNLNGALLAMRKSPTLLTLFLNERFKFLNISNFESMSEHSNVFVTCKNLRSIIGSSRLQTSIKCSPAADLAIHSPLHFWEYDGYECHWSDHLMQFICRACPVGFYSNSNVTIKKRGTCTECPSGSFYQDELASMSCKSCPVGQFVPPEMSPGKDASDCQTCPEGTNTNITAGTRACACLNGFYRIYRFGPCEKCKHDGFECTRDIIQLKKGYWMTWNGTRSSNRSCKEIFKEFILNLEVSDNSYNRSTMKFNCQLPMPVKCPIHGSCRGGYNASCSSGYNGVLCAVCSREFSRQFNRCVKCPHPIIVILEIIAYMAAFFIFCLIVSLTDKVFVPSSNESEHHDSTDRRTFSDVIMSSFKIMIGFYQVLISVMHAFRNINWPDNLQKTISLLEYIQFEVVRIPSLRCINPDWEIDSLKEFWITIFFTFTIPALCFIYFLFKLCYLKLFHSSNLEFKAYRSICKKNCLKLIAVFLFASYPLTSTKIIQILPIACHSFCTVKEKGQCLHKLSFLRSDYSMPCSKLTDHEYAMITAYCCLIIPFGLPVILWILLWRYAPKPKLSVSAMNGSSTISDTLDVIEINDSNLRFSINCEYHFNTTLCDEHEEKDRVYSQALKFAYENYDKRCWYWEVLEMIRKLIMTVGMVVLFNQTRLGLSIVVIISTTFALLHALKRPIKDSFENAVQLLSLLIVPLNLTIGAVLKSNVIEHMGYTPDDYSQSWSLGLILVILNSMILILVVGRFLKAVCKKLFTLKLKKRQ